MSYSIPQIDQDEAGWWWWWENWRMAGPEASIKRQFGPFPNREAALADLDAYVGPETE